MYSPISHKTVTGQTDQEVIFQEPQPGMSLRGRWGDTHSPAYGSLSDHQVTSFAGIVVHSDSTSQHTHINFCGLDIHGFFLIFMGFPGLTVCE